MAISDRKVGTVQSFNEGYAIVKFSDGNVKKIKSESVEVGRTVAFQFGSLKQIIGS